MKKKVQDFSGNAGDEREQRLKGPVSEKTKMKKNMQRLGGRGLSLQAFANSRSGSRVYNPSFIKNQREFYKNAKFVSKYKRSLKQKEQLDGHFVATGPLEVGGNASYEAGDSKSEKKRHKKKPSMSTKELYEKTIEAEQKARIQREAIRLAKEEERQKVEAERRSLREKMLKKTKFGQPVMKYRIEHLLETLQNST